MDASSSITYKPYSGESDLPSIISLVQSELSEPYVVYTYRYFLHQWPHLSFLAYANDASQPIGVIVCKQSLHREKINRGYIAMLSVNKEYRKQGVASALVRHSIEVMKDNGIALETEYDNAPALALYATLGFVREKRLFRFYLNGKDAFRLVLPVSPPTLTRTNSGSSASDEEPDSDREWEDVARIVRLRRKVATLRAAKFKPVWERDAEEEEVVSGR
ncbi:acyl-CoA N-acyltransferase [Amylostereum chailletii]|nr:acyl-CoA N-acyltransferase [Amylostereum chailletii]